MSNKKVSTAILISEMDQNVKRMLKLIEEDGDSFAKKAEMYYEKRPELISLIDEFQRMYRSLSERYDHSMGETKKNIALDIQSQSSCMSELCSELPSGSASPDLRPARRRSGHRAPGFDYFLGAGGNMELGYREGDELSPVDSESESDGFYVANDEENVLRRKIYDLEVDLRNTREKLRLHQEDNSEFSPTRSGHGSVEAVRPTAFEEELRDVKEKLRLSEEEVSKLSTKLSVYELMNASVHSEEENYGMDVEEQDGDGSGMEQKVVALEKRLKMVKISLGAEVVLLKKMVTEKNGEMEELTQSLAARTRNHNMVVAEKAKLGAKVEELTAQMTSKDDKIDEICQELDQLQKEQAKMSEELRSREIELETTIEEQQEIILEGAEEKREAIRQLCFSLEHYRSGYLRLRNVVVNNMKSPVMAA